MTHSDQRPMMSPDDLVEVYSTDNPSDAEIVSAALHQEGIKCEIDGEGQAGLAGVGIMEVKVLVRAEDADRARHFIRNHQHR